jgi:hypothetical protein
LRMDGGINRAGSGSRNKIGRFPDLSADAQATASRRTAGCGK